MSDLQELLVNELEGKGYKVSFATDVARQRDTLIVNVYLKRKEANEEVSLVDDWRTLSLIGSQYNCYAVPISEKNANTDDACLTFIWIPCMEMLVDALKLLLARLESNYWVIQADPTAREIVFGVKKKYVNVLLYHETLKRLTGYDEPALFEVKHVCVDKYRNLKSELYTNIFELQAVDYELRRSKLFSEEDEMDESILIL